MEARFPGRKSLNGVKLELFSEDDIREIDLATRDILTNAGVQVSDEEAIQGSDGIRLCKQLGSSAVASIYVALR